jgi:hypothetical protein
MVSAGTLMVFAVVGLALLFHRYVNPHKSTKEERVKAGVAMGVIMAAGIGESSSAAVGGGLDRYR